MEDAPTKREPDDFNNRDGDDNDDDGRMSMDGDDVADGAEEEDLARREVDIGKASSSVWLVKVPSFLAEKWRSAGPRAQLGSVTIGKNEENSSGTPSVSLSLLPEHALNSGGSDQVPQNYSVKFIAKPENVFVFSQDGPQHAHEIDGTVQYEFHATPVIDENYRNIMRMRRQAAEKPQRTTQFVEAKGNVQGVSQVTKSFLASTSLAIPPSNRKRKAEDFRRDRMPKEDLIEIVFKAFSRQEYWSLKEMVEYTNQPVAFMKEILGETCVYIARGPYKTKYQLKPEFQSLSKKDDTSTGGNANK
eukprot:Partr_v1_DN24656_c0_g1_i2_m59796 putative factor iif